MYKLSWNLVFRKKGERESHLRVVSKGIILNGSFGDPPTRPVSNLMIVIFLPICLQETITESNTYGVRAYFFYHWWPWIISVLVPGSTNSYHKDEWCLLYGGRWEGVRYPHSVWVIADGWKARWASSKTNQWKLWLIFQAFFVKLWTSLKRRPWL